MFRKVEYDWNMVYLARNSHEKSSISKFWLCFNQLTSFISGNLAVAGTRQRRSVTFCELGNIDNLV